MAYYWYMNLKVNANKNWFSLYFVLSIAMISSVVWYLKQISFAFLHFSVFPVNVHANHFLRWPEKSANSIAIIIKRLNLLGFYFILFEGNIHFFLWCVVGAKRISTERKNNQTTIDQYFFWFPFHFLFVYLVWYSLVKHMHMQSKQNKVQCNNKVSFERFHTFVAGWK